MNMLQLTSYAWVADSGQTRIVAVDSGLIGQ